MDAGRPRLTRAVKERQGTLEESRTSQSEPQWPQGDAKAPSMLAGAALVEWNRVVPDLIAQGLLPRPAVSTVALGCWWYGQWVEAAAEIEEFGRTYTTYTTYEKEGRTYTDRGRTYANPAVAQAAQAANLYLTMCGRFGLDPASAGKVTARPQTGADAKTLEVKRAERRASR